MTYHITQNKIDQIIDELKKGNSPKDKFEKLYQTLEKKKYK